jgi:carbon starvation protein CstA
MASCPAGSRRFVFWGGILLPVLVAIYVAVIAFIFRCSHYLSSNTPPVVHLLENDKAYFLDIKYESIQVKLKPGNVFTRCLSPEKVILSDASGEFKHGRVSDQWYEYANLLCCSWQQSWVRLEVARALL